MVSQKFYFIGTQLLFLSQVAQSFILLTANMEDVKKIARKFVSESLAEKIAEFVAKATEQMVTNVSEENDDNADNFQNLSQENDRVLNIGRQRYEKATRNTKSDINEEGKTKHVAYEKATTLPSNRVANQGQFIDWEKENNEIGHEKSASNEIKEKSKPDYELSKLNDEQPKYERIKHNMEPKETLEPPNHDYENPKPDYEHLKHDYEQPKLDYEQPKHEYEEPKHDYENQKHDIQPKIDYEHPKIKRPKLHREWKKLNDPRHHPNQQQLDDEEQIEEQPEEGPVHEKKPVYEKPKTVYVQPKPSRKPKNHLHSRQKVNLKDQGSPLDILPISDHKSKATFTPTVHSTILYQALRAGNTEHKKTRGHRLTGFDSKESGNTKPQLTTFQGFNIPELTTEKERTEFDQYENRNNPKAEFIATSGPVSLPKVPMLKPWWEKEMTLMEK